MKFYLHDSRRSGRSTDKCVDTVPLSTAIDVVGVGAGVVISGVEVSVAGTVAEINICRIII